jgi:hypothetical protein
VRAALLSRAAPTVREAGAYGLLLAVCSLPLFLPRVQHGGFVSDDWSNRTAYLWGEPHGAFAWLTVFFTHLGQKRPGLNSYLIATQGTLGLHMKLYLAFAVAVGWLAAVLFYVLLRMFGIARLHAGLIAALALLFPAADATVLYAGATFVELALALFLGGTILAVASVRADAPRRAAVYAVLALILFAASALLHEVAAGAIALLLAVLAVAAARRGSRGLAALYGACVVAAMVRLIVRPPQEPESFGHQISHAGTIVRQSGWLLADTAFPFGGGARIPVLVLLTVALAAAVVALSRLPGTDPRRGEIRRWLGLAGVGAVVVVAGYSVYVPSSSVWYEPLAQGPNNRVNALAALGFVMVAYALIATTVTLLSGRRTRGGVLASVAAALVGAVLLAGYAHDVHRDAGVWNRSFAAEEAALTMVKAARPTLPHGTVVYMFGPQASLEDAVPVFRSTWDFNAAVQLTYKDRTLGGVPVVPGTDIVCRATTMYPVGNGYDLTYAVPYGRQVFINAISGAAATIDSQDACRARGTRFAPG